MNAQERSTEVFRIMKSSPSQPVPMVVLISGNGSNLQAIINAINIGDISAKICAVISNQASAHGLIRAQDASIPTHVLSYAAYSNRDSYDRALIQVIEPHQPRLVILAGYMRILSDEFVYHYKGRLLNIHPSLLPKYKGLNTHQRALDAGDKVHGASVHFVTSDLDAGPVIIQAKVPILPNDDAATLAKRVHIEEHIIYPLAIQRIIQGQIRLENDTILFDDKLISEQQRLLEMRN